MIIDDLFSLYIDIFIDHTQLEYTLVSITSLVVNWIQIHDIPTVFECEE